MSLRMIVIGTLSQILVSTVSCGPAPDPSPDLVFQLRYCPPKTVTQTLKQSIPDRLRGLPDKDLAVFFKAAVAEDNNTDAGCPGNVYRLGVWRNGFVSHDDRLSALANTEPIPQDKSFSVRVRGRVLSDAFNYKWLVLPKRYDSSGKISENGEIELEDAALAYPHALQSLIHGTGEYHGTPGTAFSVNVDNRLALQDNDGINSVYCQSQTSINFDTRPVAAVAALLFPFPFAWNAQENLLSLLGADRLNAPVNIGIGVCGGTSVAKISSFAESADKPDTPKGRIRHQTELQIRSSRSR